MGALLLVLGGVVALGELGLAVRAWVRTTQPQLVVDFVPVKRDGEVGYLEMRVANNGQTRAADVRVTIKPQITGPKLADTFPDLMRRLENPGVGSIAPGRQLRFIVAFTGRSKEMPIDDTTPRRVTIRRSRRWWFDQSSTQIEHFAHLGYHLLENPDR